MKVSEAVLLVVFTGDIVLAVGYSLWWETVSAAVVNYSFIE